MRVGEAIRRELADILLRGDAHDPDLATHTITVSEVRPSPDLKIATVFVAPLGGRDPDGAIKALAGAAGRLRSLLGRALNLKYAPQLRFRIDETFDRMDDARRMFADERVRRDVDEAPAAKSEDEAGRSDDPSTDGATGEVD